jgi:hypothetical protein
MTKKVLWDKLLRDVAANDSSSCVIRKTPKFYQSFVRSLLSRPFLSRPFLSRPFWKIVLKDLDSSVIRLLRYLIGQ